jgi:hypothetical protein
MLKKLILAAAALGLAVPAFADGGHGRFKHRWKQHRPQVHYYHPRPVVVMPPPHVYYVPPPRVVYAPPAPVYYTPPPVVHYPAPEPSMSVRFRINL